MTAFDSVPHKALLTLLQHVGASGAPEKLTLEDSYIKRVYRVTYLGSVLDNDGDPSNVVSANI